MNLIKSCTIDLLYNGHVHNIPLAEKNKETYHFLQIKYFIDLFVNYHGLEHLKNNDVKENVEECFNFVCNLSNCLENGESLKEIGDYNVWSFVKKHMEIIAGEYKLYHKKIDDYIRMAILDIKPSICSVGNSNPDVFTLTPNFEQRFIRAVAEDIYSYYFTIELREEALLLSSNVILEKIYNELLKLKK